MHIAATGSIATDHPTVRPGHAADQLVGGSPGRTPPAFLADEPGCVLATEVPGAVGTQEHRVSAAELIRRIERSPAGAP
ncbi:hypothetical protein ABTX77_35045 [Streptomyces sp. NPDC097704]|uniref:hypothetical protein n=1 Tax=Streptomyces sp. NPDC097704 TaxID=3157101 RepID=UPI00332803C9